MPEEIELDTESLRETIDKEIEREGTSFLRAVAFITALLAAVTAVVSLEAGATVNEALILKSDATTLQARASDQWAYYQAKGIKSAIATNAASGYAAAGRAAPDSLRGVVARYEREQKSIQAEAKKLETDRDARNAESESMMARHHHYAVAIALLQIAIALGAIAALTRQRLALAAAGLSGVGGIALALIAALHH